MKSILKILAGVLIVALAVLAFAALNGHLYSLLGSGGVISASCLPLIGLRRKCGPKPGGNKRLYLAVVDDFEDVEFPTYDMLATNGKITGTSIPLLEDAEFIEIQAAYDTTKWGFGSKGKVGSQSFEQNITFEVNGIDEDSIKLATRFLNRPLLIIAKANNNKMYLIGSIDNPLELELTGDSGAKGTDPQKITFTAKNDGYMTPPAPLDPLVVIRSHRCRWPYRRQYFFIYLKISSHMALIKFVIDKNFANKHYLVAGNRLRLGDVDTDAVAEKLFNAKVKGVSLVEVPSTVPIIETAVTDPQPALLAEVPATTAKKK